MANHSKRYDEMTKKIEAGREYQPDEAVILVKETSKAKFDETVELHLRMGLDPRQATQQLRGVALLPYGLGKPVRVAVFAQGDAAKTAEQAGADIVGAEELVKRVEEGFTEFDIAIATRT